MNIHGKVIALLCLLLITLPSSAQRFRRPINPATKIAPPGFIENKGQIVDQKGVPNTGVKYLLPGRSGLNVQARANSFSYDSFIADSIDRQNMNTRGNEMFKDYKPPHIHFHRVDITFPGSNPAPMLIAEERSADSLIYYTSATPNGVAVHHYAKLTYYDLYDGIDLVLESSESGKFEYYFIIHPGADPRKINIQYKGGATALEKNTIAIQVKFGKISERIPLSYIIADDTSAAPVPVTDTRYVQERPGVYGFHVAPYDHSKTLVIDPVPDLVWGTYYGSTLNDWAYSVAKDNAGNIIMGGGTDNSNNIATSGVYQSVYGGNSDAMLGKFKSDGTLLWMTYFGGNSVDAIFAVGTDLNNDIYFGGWTQSDGVIATAGAHQLIKDYGVDGYLERFTPAGTRVWGTYYGGDDAEAIESIKVDNAGNIFMAGWTQSTNNIGSPGSYQPVYGGGVLNDAGDGFLVRFSPTGVRQWGTYYGGTSFDRFYDMDIDNAGFIYCTGITYSTASIASSGAFQSTFAGGVDDAFLVKFNIAGSRQWATYYGSSNEDWAEGLCVDNAQHITISGMTTSQSGLATTGTEQPSYGGGIRDAFVAQFTTSGSRTWCTYLGGGGEEIGRAIACDANNNLYVTGNTYSNSNISTANAYQTGLNGPNITTTTYLIKYNGSGIRQWGTYYGLNGPYPSGEGVAIVVAGGDAFICGYTTFTTNISTCGSAQPTWGGNTDAFLARFSDVVTSAPSVSIAASPPGPYCAGATITFTATPLNAGTGFTYQWKVNGTNAGANAANFASSTLANGDVVSCTITTVPSVCNPTGTPVNSNSITVTIAPAVTPAVSISASATTICQGMPVTFTATPTNGGALPVYQWKVNGNSAGTSNPTFVSSTLANGDIITCDLTSNAACKTTATVTSNSISVNVTAAVVPVVTITADPDDICEGEAVSIAATIQNYNGMPNYQWRLNGSNAGSNSPIFSGNSFADGDMIDCIVTGPIPNCPNPVTATSNSVAINVRAVPHVSLSPQNSSLFYGQSVQLNGSSTGTIASFSWSPVAGLTTVASLTPVASPTDNTIYTLTVTDVNGCSAFANATITVYHDIYIPSAFTPNDDGKNDVFRIPAGVNITLDDFSVYDRWGVRVFSTKNPLTGWDGTYAGKLSPVDVYVYILRGRTSKGEIFLKGIVSLIR